MKNKIKSISLFCLLIILVSFQSGDVLCNSKDLKDKAKKQLDPFNYDNFELTRINFRNKETFKEIEIPLFIGEKYRVVFEMEALPKQVMVEIYNRERENKKRKLLFTSKDIPADKTEFIYEVSKTRRIYINYIIPAGDETAKSGCALYMIGYK
jgi:hypothetical protein